MKSFWTFFFVVILLYLGCKLYLPTVKPGAEAPLVRIRQIKARPEAFYHRAVYTKGRVTSSWYLLFWGGYTLHDGTGALPVYTTDHAPIKGAEITVLLEPKPLLHLNGTSRIIGTEIRIYNRSPDFLFGMYRGTGLRPVNQ